MNKMGNIMLKNNTQIAKKKLMVELKGYQAYIVFHMELGYKNRERIAIAL